MAAGLSRPESAPAAAAKAAPPERARGLVDLDKFVLDPAEMPPAASSYFRRHAFLPPDACRKWCMGCLPRVVGGQDRSGSTMRGKIVYPYISETGELLTWFGPDPEYEEKRRKWDSAGNVDREPEKFHFVKGFHRGIELFGQHAFRQDAVRQKLSAWAYCSSRARML
jgi:hypothetical protein